jgi:hypothetical protein
MATRSFARIAVDLGSFMSDDIRPNAPAVDADRGNILSVPDMIAEASQKQDTEHAK